MTPHKDRLPQTPERLVFGGGGDPKRHPVTDMALETGIGCATEDRQAEMQCAVIEQREGKAAADAMRAKLADYTAMKVEQAKLAAAQAKVKTDGVAVAS